LAKLARVAAYQPVGPAYFLSSRALANKVAKWGAFAGTALCIAGVAVDEKKGLFPIVAASLTAALSLAAARRQRNAEELLTALTIGRAARPNEHPDYVDIQSMENVVIAYNKGVTEQGGKNYEQRVAAKP
jgi:hypothetical protein